MSVLKKIIGQSLVFFVGSVVSVIIGFFFKIYLSRHLGAEGLGLYALGVSILGILGIFLSLGYGNGLVKFVSKYIAEKKNRRLYSYINNTLVINVLISSSLGCLFFFFPAIISEFLLSNSRLTPYVPYFGGLLFINGILVIADQSIRGLQEVKSSTLINTFVRLPIKIGVTVCLFSFGIGLEGYILAEIIGGLLAAFLLGRLIVRLLPGTYLMIVEKTNSEEKQFRFNLLFTNTLLALQRYGDRFIIVIFLSETELGIYSVVLTIATFIPLVLSSVNSIFQPIISSLFSQNLMTELAYYFKLCTRYIFIISFPLIAFTILFNQSIMGVFGNEFLIGSSLLIYIVVGELLNVSIGPVGSMLQMCGLERELRNISIISSVVSFFLYYLLIQSFGLTGLGLGYIFSRLVINLGSAIVLYKNHQIHFFHSAYLKAIILFLSIFSIVAFFTHSLVFNAWFLCFVLLAIYLIFGGLWYLLLGKKEIPKLIDLYNQRNK
ncbi:MAG: oligosaccharide flippase family protein [Bacteroidota bacterium]|nr:oligosaccharide flippase family protein [Bacteroidota bacterium]